MFKVGYCDFRDASVAKPGRFRPVIAVLSDDAGIPACSANVAWLTPSVVASWRSLPPTSSKLPFFSDLAMLKIKTLGEVPPFKEKNVWFGEQSDRCQSNFATEMPADMKAIRATIACVLGLECVHDESGLEVKADFRITRSNGQVHFSVFNPKTKMWVLLPINLKDILEGFPSK